MSDRCLEQAASRIGVDRTRPGELRKHELNHSAASCSYLPASCERIHSVESHPSPPKHAEQQRGGTRRRVASECVVMRLRVLLPCEFDRSFVSPTTKGRLSTRDKQRLREAKANRGEKGGGGGAEDRMVGRASSRGRVRARSSCRPFGPPLRALVSTRAALAGSGGALTRIRTVQSQLGRANRSQRKTGKGRQPPGKEARKVEGTHGAGATLGAAARAGLGLGRLGGVLDAVGALALAGSALLG
jgi:hypothetical protein